MRELYASRDYWPEPLGLLFLVFAFGLQEFLNVGFLGKLAVEQDGFGFIVQALLGISTQPRFLLQVSLPVRIGPRLKIENHTAAVIPALICKVLFPGLLAQQFFCLKNIMPAPTCGIIYLTIRVDNQQS